MSDFFNIVSELEEKYKDNSYMKHKLETYIKNLPILMNNIEQQHNKRDKLKKKINLNKNLFIEKFLTENLFFYIPQTEIFVYYNNNNYNIIKEDDILHLIINTINNYEPELQQWKFKIKTNIIKIIKESCLFSTIPESETIQYILNNFYPNIFKTKNHIKHFLTIVGDNILNKKDNNVFFVNNLFKNFIKILSQQLFIVLNKNYTDCFKFKYSDHKFELSRILYINTDKFDELFIRNNILNIIVVACYYSNRYNSSDNFIKSCNDTELENSVLILKNNNSSTLIDNFMSEFTIKSDSHMSFKDVYLLWKQFLKKYSLPYFINQSYIKSILAEKNIYDIENDCCPNIKSKSHSHWVEFENFWSETITESDIDENNYEISELTMLFNEWALTKNLSTSITEENFKEIYLSYYPDAYIEDNKYIHNIYCNLWDKTSHIDVAIQSFDKTISKNKIKMYKHYCKFINDNYNNKYIVSKSYFDKYIDK
tara:strand:- start:1321 stop:2766 length:1446 start_codon:yes stop_codon:yes gene_type:complete